MERQREIRHSRREEEVRGKPKFQTRDFKRSITEEIKNHGFDSRLHTDVLKSLEDISILQAGDLKGKLFQESRGPVWRERHVGQVVEHDGRGRGGDMAEISRSGASIEWEIGDEDYD
nr:hypothetical protein Iba_scaffold1481428CG0010 [Ipomoea batatas]GMD67190.1 hypothetical protein Iba_scaffold1493050CG0010 [Ipomoea batatas]